MVEDISNFINNSSSICGCKGIRKCGLCAPELTNVEKINELENLKISKDVYFYCSVCNLCTRLDERNKKQIEVFLNEREATIHSTFGCICDQYPLEDRLFISGIFLSKNFINQDEESYLLSQIDKSPWIISQSGRLKQDYGPKANFNKKKLKYSTFTGLPGYSRPLIERLENLRCELLQDFSPVELCNLKYESKRGACIDPHLDDTWLWGNRLITINLLSNTFLTLKPVDTGILPDCEVLIPLERYSLIVLCNDARYKWLHSIKKSNIVSSRIAITLRELSNEFKNENIGKFIENLALSYRGVSIGYVEQLFKSNYKAQLLSNNHSSLSDTTKLQIRKKINNILNGELELKEINNSSMICYKDGQEISINISYSKEIGNLNEISVNLQNNPSMAEFIRNFIIHGFNLGNNNVCLMNSIDSIFKNIDLNNLSMFFKIGKSIAEWRIYSQKNFDQAKLLTEFIKSNKTDDLNFIILKNDFLVFEQLILKKIDNLNLDLTIKCRTMALINELKNLFDDINSNVFLDQFVGLILDEFKLNSIYLKNEKEIFFSITFQRLKLEMFMWDLAGVIADLIENCQGISSDARSLIKELLAGYKSVYDIDNKEFKILEIFILLNLILNQKVTIDLFDELYLLDNILQF